MYYPIILNLSGRRVVVAGGGDVAAVKAQSLLEAGARVTVVSPDLTAELRGLAQAGALLHLPRRYESEDLAGAFLVIAATNDTEVQEQIWRDAHRLNVLVNTADRPDRCDFIVPAIVRQKDLIVAVSTSGKSPAMAAWLRRRLSEWLTPEFGRVAGLLGSIRDEIRHRFKTVGERKRAYERILETDIVSWIAQCDDTAAKSRVREIIEEL